MTGQPGAPDWRPSWAVMGRPYANTIDESMEAVLRLARSPEARQALRSMAASLERLGTEMRQAAIPLGDALRKLGTPRT